MKNTRITIILSFSLAIILLTLSGFITDPSVKTYLIYATGLLVIVGIIPIFSILLPKNMHVISGKVEEKNMLPIGYEFKVNNQVVVDGMTNHTGCSENDYIDAVSKSFDGKYVVQALNNYSTNKQHKQSPIIRLSFTLFSVILTVFLFNKLNIIESFPQDLSFLYLIIISFLALAALFYIRHLLFILKVNKQADALWLESNKSG